MNEAFESIKTGLEEAISYTRGESAKIVVHKLSSLDVKSIRSNIGMTQREFAISFGISLGTLRHWERGDRQPHGPARVLLNVLAKKPGVVMDILASQT